MTKVVKNELYKTATTAVDASGVVTFTIVEGHIFNFELGRLELQRLARQIEDALKVGGEKAVRERKERTRQTPSVAINSAMQQYKVCDYCGLAWNGGKGHEKCDDQRNSR